MRDSSRYVGVMFLCLLSSWTMHVWGCGGSSMSAQDFFDKLVTAACKRTFQCADKYGPAYPDMDSCRRTIERFVGPAIGFAPDWIRIDQARAEACLEHYSSCDYFTEHSMRRAAAALRSMKTGIP